MNNTSTILVTGANGHLGFNLVKCLAEQGYVVRASARDHNDASKTKELKNIGLSDIVSLDIRDTNSFVKACDGIDVLFHVAATYKYVLKGKDA